MNKNNTVNTISPFPNNDTRILTPAHSILTKLQSHLINPLINQIGVKCGIIAIILLLSCVSLLVNHLTYQYQPYFFPRINFDNRLIPFTFFFIVSFYFEPYNLRFALFCRVLGSYYLFGFVLLFADIAIQITPFSMHDYALYYLDQKLGFDTIGLLNWMHQHPLLNLLSSSFYTSLFPMMILSPMALALLADHRQVDIYFVSLLLSGLIGYAIYYFYPSNTPAAILHSAYFTPEQHNVFTQFYQVHHHQIISSPQAGLIAFPSFHVIWAVMVAYLFKNRKFLFPIMGVYALIIMATIVTTGWHYFVDVPGGILVAAISIYLAEKFVKIQSLRDKNPHPNPLPQAVRE